MINELMLISIFFVTQLIQVYGKLTVLRELSSFGTKLICISEDDGGALVWNYRFRDEANIFELDSKTELFPRTCALSTSNINCKMNDDESCLRRWKAENWKLTHSMDNPMGPVFDERWEEFSKNIARPYPVEAFNTNKKAVVPFSVREDHAVNILICKQNILLCYTIVMGEYNNTRSFIQKCRTRKLSGITFDDKNWECKEGASVNYTALSPYKWRSFVLTWDPATRNISLYDDKLIVTYTDTEKFDNSNTFYGLYYSSKKNTPITFHRYTFFYTHNYNAILTSPTFSPSNNTICLQLIIGLCAECNADIILRDVVSNNTVRTVTAKGSSVSTAHGLPMWQSVKIEMNFSTLSYNSKCVNWQEKCLNNVKLQVVPKLILPSFNPIWAIANVRECLPKGCFKIIVGNAWYFSERYNSDQSQYKVRCQKLFYQDQSIVNPFLNPNFNVKLDNADCNNGYIGPGCSFQCKKTPPNNLANCNKTAVCYKNGCTCSPGFKGLKCDQSCNKGFYGHACKQKCGNCSKNKSCGPTGDCLSGCKIIENHVYLPPLCQTDIGKLEKPQIRSINQTTIIATAPIKWWKDFEKQEVFYSFRIQDFTGKLVQQQEEKQIFKNTTQLEGKFQNLKPDTSYIVTYILLSSSWPIISDSVTVETYCILPYAPRNFTYSLDNSVVNLKWLHPLKACGLRLQYFRITIEAFSSNLRNSTLPLPHLKTVDYLVTNSTNYTKQLYLLPSTYYVISIATVTSNKKSSNKTYEYIETSSNIGLEDNIIVSQSDSELKLHIPKVLNNTRNSTAYVVLIAPNNCEYNANLPENLSKYLGEKRMKKIFFYEPKINDLDNRTITVNSENMNCPLRKGQYEIILIITENEFSAAPIIFEDQNTFHVKQSWSELWFIIVILICCALSAVFYFYKNIMYYISLYLKIVS